LDGLRVDFENWWFNVRPSNTEDLLRIVVEAKTKSLMQGKLKQIKKIIVND
jgi:phosphomannomutase